jgi:hypothetical protein
MTKLASDAEIRRKGLKVLFKGLGEVDAIRFLSQINYEKKDYIELQDKLFQGMTVEEIYSRAEKYSKKK